MTESTEHSMRPGPQTTPNGRRPRSQARRQQMGVGYYPPEEPTELLEPMPTKRPGPRLALVLLLLAAILTGLIWGGIEFNRYLQQQSALRAERERLAELAREKARHPYLYRGLIEDYAREKNLDPAFVAAVVLCESSFRPDAESYLGARGLMQLMPDTAEWVAGKLKESYDFDRMYDPETNIRFGCWFLGYLSQRFDGDPIKMAAGYHTGADRVSNWMKNPEFAKDDELVAIPDESTDRYVKKVMSAYAMYIKHYYTPEESSQSDAAS